MTIKLTKNELRDQQHRLNQLEKYLPTLQLKKAMLQSEVIAANFELENMKKELNRKKDRTEDACQLLDHPGIQTLMKGLHITQKRVEYENIAGVDLHQFKGLDFESPSYSLYDTPLWYDSMLEQLRELVKAKEKVEVQKEKKRRLENELREVSIRVNLFEKIMIPKAKANIKKIRVFLGDQQLAAVSMAKVAKAKIEASV